MRAHRIAVIDDGRLVELGSHDELVAQNGRYAQMFRTWESQGKPSDASGAHGTLASA